MPATNSTVRRSEHARGHKVLFAAFVAMSAFVAAVQGKETLPTPLEAAGYSRLSTTAEISAYLDRLVREYPQARIETIGATVQGRPLQALLLTGVPGGDVSTPNRLTIEIVGSQHGTEYAGAESLLFIARDLVAGTLRHVLNDIDVVLIPNANPDGRELGTRMNANCVNLNTDFVTLGQPESRALIVALQRYRPEVALDVHESAVLKRKSLAREGYMTDFMVQFEVGNNPNIVPALYRFARGEVLTPWIAAVNGAGLRTHRYIGEIKSSRQPVTNGGLTLNNLRNRTAIEGSLSLLMETRLDPKDGEYPTFRNIGVRVATQRVSIERFLRLLHSKRGKALAAVAAGRPQSTSAPLVLGARYVAGRGNSRVSIDLRRIEDGELESIDFADHRTIATSSPIAMPAAYLIREHRAKLRELLDAHGIEYHILAAPRAERAVEFKLDSAAATASVALDNVRRRTVRIQAATGDLWIDLEQPRGRLAALLLEPRSNSSFLRAPKFAPLVTAGEPLPIYRIPR